MAQDAYWQLFLTAGHGRHSQGKPLSLCKVCIPSGLEVFKHFSISLHINDSVQIFELNILDALAVENAVKQAKDVLNCIGLFWHYSFPVF
jgi:hypothetical protein